LLTKLGGDAYLSLASSIDDSHAKFKDPRNIEVHPILRVLSETISSADATAKNVDMLGEKFSVLLNLM
jgi:hypothetical protein